MNGLSVLFAPFREPLILFIQYHFLQLVRLLDEGGSKHKLFHSFL